MNKLPAHKNLENPPGQTVNRELLVQCADQMSAKQVAEHHTLGEYIQQETHKIEQEEKSLGQVAWEAYKNKHPAGWIPDYHTAGAAYQDIWKHVATSVVRAFVNKNVKIL